MTTNNVSTGSPKPSFLMPQTHATNASNVSAGSQDVTNLEKKLQTLLQQFPKDSFTSSRPKTVSFQFESEESKKEKDKTHGLQPLNPEAKDSTSVDKDALLVEMIKQVSSDMGKVSERLHQQTTALSTMDSQKESDAESALEKKFNKQQETQEAKQKEQDSKMQEQEIRSAKQQWLQTGLNTTGAGIFALIAIPAVMTPVPVIAGPAAAAMALFAKVGVAGTLFNILTGVVNAGSQLATNPHKWTAGKDIISGLYSAITGMFPTQKAGTSKTKDVRFGGHGSEQATSATSQKEMTQEALVQEYGQSMQQFLQKVDQASSELDVVDAAQELQRTTLNATAEYLLAHGTPEQKEQVEKVQQFHTNYEAYVQAIPAHAQRYGDLPAAVQDHVRQMVYDTLTSDVPALIVWGQSQAKAMGMSAIQINQVQQKKKGNSAMLSFPGVKQETTYKPPVTQVKTESAQKQQTTGDRVQLQQSQSIEQMLEQTEQLLETAKTKPFPHQKLLATHQAVTQMQGFVQRQTTQDATIKQKQLQALSQLLEQTRQIREALDHPQPAQKTYARAVSKVEENLLDHLIFDLAHPVPELAEKAKARLLELGVSEASLAKTTAKLKEVQAKRKGVQFGGGDSLAKLMQDIREQAVQHSSRNQIINAGTDHQLETVQHAAKPILFGYAAETYPDGCVRTCTFDPHSGGRTGPHDSYDQFHNIYLG